MIDNKIHILPDFIANQIAAGEVVQRPESVVKELVENSLDSGADEIAVIIQDGGKQLISIIDNGCGMSNEDLLLSVKRHATSKISTQEDLERITTFGFRGEALASISSVSNLEIRTRFSENPIGARLISEPNKEPVVESYNQEKGTQIFVKNLFYNVPARRKFLKSKLTEVRHISDTLIRFALANPNVRFTYYNEDLLIFDVKPSSIKERIQKLLGGSTNDGFMQIEYENELMKVTGFIGNPSLARPSSSGQYLFVNRRPIESRNLSFAIYSAFEQLLEKNHKPVYVINLEIDPEKIDVNIHPQKHEVKFDNENYVYNTLRKAVNSTLTNNNLTSNLDINNKLINQPFIRIKDNAKPDNFFLVNQLTGEVIQSNISENENREPGRSKFETKNFSHLNENFQKEFNKESFNNLMSRNSFESDSRNSENLNLTNMIPEGKNIFNSKLSLDKIRNELPYSNYWQLHNKYIIVETNSGIIFVDQHNAHERVIFESAIDRLNNIYSKGNETLFPIEIKLKITYISVLQEIEEEIKNLGFEFKIILPDILILHSKPYDVPNGQEESTIIEILDDYLNSMKLKHTNKREKIAATFSCKSAIKTGEKLTPEKMKQLTIDLFNCKMPYVCPHGRPIILELSLYDLDKQFGRI